MEDRPPPSIPSIHCFSVSVAHTSLKLSHTHDAHEFFLCTGRPGTQFTDTNEFAMKRGDLFLFPAGQHHHANAPHGSACDGLVLNVADAALSSDREGERDLVAMLESLCERAWRGDNRIRVTAKTAAQVERALWDMDREQRSMLPGHRSAIRAGLQRFYLALLRDANILPGVQGSLGGTQANERLAEVMRLLEHNYMEPLTIERAARLARLSRSRFHDVFREWTGATFVQYLAGVRVKAARRMLLETDAPIIEVADSCGFPSLSHFYHVFKRSMGSTPRETRLGGD
jgi:AraC family transcriptional regulator